MLAEFTELESFRVLKTVVPPGLIDQYTPEIHVI